MSRPPRLEFGDAIYHVTSRCNERSLSFAMNLIFTCFFIVFMVLDDTDFMFSQALYWLF